jgi:hypothetical protein
MGHKVRVQTDGPRRAVVEVDGHEIQNVVIALAMEAGGDRPHLTLDLAAWNTDITIDGACVEVAENLAAALERLGWTPPADGA